MKYLHYKVLGKNIESRDPKSHCALSEDLIVINSTTFEELEATIKLRDASPDILDNCGWLFEGEEQKLLNSGYTDILRSNVYLREQRIKKQEERAQQKGKVKKT